MLNLMDSNSGYIDLGSQKLHYLKCGNGKKALLAFHGYGHDAHQLLPIAEYLKEDFSVYSFDLPHHGKSRWDAPVCLQPADLNILVEQIKILHDVSTVSLIGYSIGGRVCLKIAEQVPFSIDKIILIASDGLVFNYFYYFLTRTMPGKFLFRSFLTNPAKYMPLVEWARKRNIIDASRYKLATQYLKTKQDRDFVLKVWPCLYLMVPDYKRLKRVLHQHHIKIHLFMGAYDRVIPVALAHRFCKQFPDALLHIVQKGHLAFDKDTMPSIAQSLLM